MRRSSPPRTFDFLVKISIFILGLFLAGTATAQTPEIQIGGGLPCGIDYSVQYMDPMGNCYMVPSTAPITGTVYPGPPVTLPPGDVYDILVSYQGTPLFHYNCALFPPVATYDTPLGSTCSSAPGVTEMTIRWGRTLITPPGVYDWKISAEMVP